MNADLVVPAADAVPLPGPVWLLYGLLIFVFCLHVVPMSVMLGGGFWSIVIGWRARRDAELAGLSRRLDASLTYWTAAAITTGVAALLFLQVLYGQVFYAASVVIAWPWLSVVALLIMAYYGTYFRAYQAANHPRLAFWVGAASWVLLALIAFIYVNQMTLMIHPERHKALYAASARGWHLNLAEPTLAARYLHMLVAAVVMGALWVAILGLRTGSKKAFSLAMRGVAIATLVEVAVGMWLLMGESRETMRLFMGRDGLATASLALAMPVAGAMLLIAWRASAGTKPVIALGALAVAMIVLMILMRDVVRRAALKGAVDFSAMRESPQWGVIAIFALTLVAGIAVVGWMVAAARGKPQAQ